MTNKITQSVFVRSSTSPNPNMWDNATVLIYNSIGVRASASPRKDPRPLVPSHGPTLHDTISINADTLHLQQGQAWLYRSFVPY